MVSMDTIGRNGEHKLCFPNKWIVRNIHSITSYYDYTQCFPETSPGRFLNMVQKKELPHERHGERHQYGGTTPEQHTAAAAAATTTRRSLSVGPDCALFGPVHGRQDGAERVPADGGHRGAIPAANKPMGVSRPWES